MIIMISGMIINTLNAIDVMLYAFLSDMNIMLCGIIILLSGMWGGGEDLAN